MDRGYRPRSPDRGYPPPRDIDSYTPGGRPPRDRSPPARYRGRSRSPPRPAIDSYRGPSRRPEGSIDSYAPGKPRSPPRRDYYDERGSMRERSPPGRTRELGPPGRPPLSPRAREYGRPRSPPPRDSYRARSPPRRDERAESYPTRRSGPGSAVSSRRSSPRPYARAPEAYPTEDYRAAPGSYRSPRPRSPPRRDAPPPRPQSIYREEDPYASRSRPLPDHDYPLNGSAYPPAREPAPPIDYRDRPPPTGPSASYRDPQMSPPSGPVGAPPSGPVSMSAHNRPGSTFSQPPARGGYHPSYRGRGGPPPSRDYPPREFSGPPPGPRGSYGAPPTYGGRGGPPPRDYGAPYDPRGPPRRDPAAGYGQFPRGGGGMGNATSLTTPRTQRFNQHLADIPKIKPGGEALPLPYETTKADKLEEEAARLRKMIDEKEMKKRQGSREWENLERESNTAALRSELAEEHLRSLNGEDSVGAAAF